jgi:protein STE50
MAYAGGTTYHADSDADDEYERSVMTSPTQLHTDSETSSDPPSNEHTPTTFEPPDDSGLPRTIITEWTAEECAQFVSTLNLRQYCQVFIDHGIEGEALIALKHDELKEMGIASVGHRLTILKNVYDQKVNQDVPIEPDDYVPPSESQARTS